MKENITKEKNTSSHRFKQCNIFKHNKYKENHKILKVAEIGKSIIFKRTQIFTAKFSTQIRKLDFFLF